MKRCTTCGEAKAHDQFYRDKRRPDGLYSACKSCHNARTKRFYQANKKRAKALNKARYENNKDEILAWHTRYREENREKRREVCLRWYHENKEQAKAISQAWAARNPERVREKAAKYRKRHPERIKAVNRKTRKQREALAPLDDTAYAFTEILLLDRCVFCPELSAEIDHIEPVALEGTNAWDNLAGICARCNRSKHARPLLFHLLKLDSRPSRSQGG